MVKNIAIGVGGVGFDSRAGNTVDNGSLTLRQLRVAQAQSSGDGPSRPLLQA